MFTRHDEEALPSLELQRTSSDLHKSIYKKEQALLLVPGHREF